MAEDPLSSIIIIFFLLIISGLLSGSETSITSVSKSKIHKLSNRGDVRAKKVLKLIDKKNDLVSSILIGNNIINILASVLATALLIKYYGDKGILYSTIVMSALIVIFSEVFPKNYALLKPDRFVLAMSGPLTIFSKLLLPFIIFLRFINFIIFKLIRVDTTNKITSKSAREDIRNIINMHEDEGRLLKDESDMLNAILDLKEITVEKIMTHRKNIYSINIEETNTFFTKIAQSSFSRIPVWKNSPNNILGLIHAKNVLSNLDDTGTLNINKIKENLIKPWFIPETTKAKDQLNEFIKRKEKLAFIVDEYGELMGLISMEDIIEEIVGNIFDEKDFSTIGIRRLENNIFRIRGDVNIRDINRELDINIPEGTSSTIAGYIIDQTESFPDVGQTFAYDGIMYEIINKNKNQITQIKLTLPKKITTH
ncbi:MAG: CNNM domain-containing protein [Proteobacteria bacterium]|jgi:Mg2+/Co2+ transporter CorB|nr:CNNM domain-containing protein [Pseudomonadota bacterium]MDC0375537.1 CNNM domain-containing protein [Pelagibacteraceae bacterium]